MSTLCKRKKKKKPCRFLLSHITEFYSTLFRLWFLILHVRSKYPVSEMFRQDDLSQFFLGNSGPLKRQNEQRTQYFRDYEKSKRSRQFLKEWKQNRPWLVDTDRGCSGSRNFFEPKQWMIACTTTSSMFSFMYKWSGFVCVCIVLLFFISISSSKTKRFI